MSITPGWKAEDQVLEMARKFPHFPRWAEIIMDKEFYYLDNESEYKQFPRTKIGWEELCETMKGFEP